VNHSFALYHNHTLHTEPFAVADETVSPSVSAVGSSVILVSATAFHNYSFLLIIFSLFGEYYHEAASMHDPT